MVRSGDLGQVFSRLRQLRPGLAASTPPTTTGACWPRKAASCGRWPTSARTGWTWSSSSPALEVEAVCADLKTVHPVRQRPKGEVADVQRQGGADRRHGAGRRSRTEDYGCSCSASGAAARACLWVSQVTAGRKNCLRFEIAGSEAGAGLGQRIAQRAVDRPPRAANESLIRDPALLSDAARRLHQLSGRPQRGLPRHLQAVLPRVLRLHRGRRLRRAATFPTFADGHARSCCARRSCRAIAEGRWVDVMRDA